MTFTLLSASGFARRPWKNGLGETITIASAAEGEGWQDVLWSLSRTEIVNDGPFSDFSGYVRWQVVIEGAGLVLETPAGEIDLRRPFEPVRYDGGLTIRARLEAGPVGVVNLIARAAAFEAAMRVLAAGETVILAPGTHILFAPACDVGLTMEGARHLLVTGDAARLDLAVPSRLSSAASPLIVASIARRD